MPARVKPLNSAEVLEEGTGHRLALEWCRYTYTKDSFQYGYRFIWKRPNGNRIAHRGQARIPSKKIADQLWKMAEVGGWADMESAS